LTHPFLRIISKFHLSDAAAILNAFEPNMAEWSKILELRDFATIKAVVASLGFKI
jgi:hypothetical protein